MSLPLDAQTVDINQAYGHCLQLARNHYENFPVASRLLPRRLQRPIAVIYAFARGADDFADEGNFDAAERLARLDDYAAKLDAIDRGEPLSDPIFIALADVIAHHQLPLQLFHDLLTAFRQDVIKKRYANFAEVLAYCRYSANPVGRLVLHLAQEATPDNLRDSDAICSALQLINFWQDLAQDLNENDRIYLPEDEMTAYGIDGTQLAKYRNDPALQALLIEHIQRARRLMMSGAPLGGRLRGRLGMEIRATVQGGLRILDALARRDDPFIRPRLGYRDWLSIARHALLP